MSEIENNYFLYMTNYKFSKIVNVYGKQYKVSAPSTSKDKKYDVLDMDGKKILSFGSLSMEHFNDRIGYYKKLNHGDIKRRKSYLARSAGIINKEGNFTKDDPESPNYWSRTFLWK